MTDPVESLARTIAETAHDGQVDKAGEPPPTLAQAVRYLLDDLSETHPVPELDADGNHIGPYREAEWDGMDDDPQTVRVDLEALCVLLEHVRETTDA